MIGDEDAADRIDGLGQEPVADRGRRVTVALTAAGRALDGPLEGSAEACVARLLEGTSCAELNGAKLLLSGLSRELRRSLERPLAGVAAGKGARGRRRTPRRAGGGDA